MSSPIEVTWDMVKAGAEELERQIAEDDLGGRCREDVAEAIILAALGQSRARTGKRALGTPPTPHKHKLDGPLNKGDFFLVVGNQMRIARVLSRDPETETITADLYRNLEDYKSGVAMRRNFTFRI